MTWIARMALLLIALAAGTTVWFVRELQPASAGAFLFFATWLVLPHAIMTAALVFAGRRRTISFHWHVVPVVVSAGGILFLADVIFWHPDAQGAIAVLMTPVFQAIASAFLLPIAWWVSRQARS